MNVMTSRNPTMAGSTLDERRVRYLYEAVQAGSVRAAADALDMNPSVISRQISQLEASLAISLLERHGRGVKPTEAGQVLVEHYRQHASNRDDVLAKLQAIRGLKQGHVELVLGEGFVSDLMGEPLNAFWQRHPGLTIAMNLAGTNEVIRRVAEDRAHIGLVYNPPVSPGIRSRAAVRQPMCAIVPPGHPLTRAGRPPTLRQLATFPVALMHPSYGTRQVIELAERMENLRFSPKLTTDSISVVKHFVRAGFGISLLPAFSVAKEIDAGELLAIPVEQSMLARAEAHIITRLGRQLSPAANQLLLQLTGVMQAFRDPPQASPGSRARNRPRADSH